MHFIQIGVFGLVMGIIFVLPCDTYKAKNKNLTNLQAFIKGICFVVKVVVVFLMFPITFPLGMLWVLGAKSETNKKQSNISSTLEAWFLKFLDN